MVSVDDWIRLVHGECCCSPARPVVELEPGAAAVVRGSTLLAYGPLVASLAGAGVPYDGEPAEAAYGAEYGSPVPSAGPGEPAGPPGAYD